MVKDLAWLIAIQFLDAGGPSYIPHLEDRYDGGVVPVSLPQKRIAYL
jgi:hypothetical protein